MRHAITSREKPVSGIRASLNSGGPEVALTSPKGIMPGRYGKKEFSDWLVTEVPMDFGLDR